jgi:hypothetical protein
MTSVQLAVVLACLALAGVLFLLWAMHAVLGAVRDLLAQLVRDEQARRSEMTAQPVAPEITRDERIQRARGCLAACHGAELALASHADDVQAALALAHYRAVAAHARAELRVLGVAP